MSWVERNTKDKSLANMTDARAKLLDQVKAEKLPTIKKEADGGGKPFNQVDFQPVRSPKNYDAEFGVKYDDVVFHFWPWQFHETPDGQRPPRFAPDFEKHLRDVMGETFNAQRLEIQHDSDVGAWFVKAKGYGTNLFFRELCIKACEKLHYALGGD